MKLYRVEHSSTKKGMWNTFCPQGKPLVTYLSNRVVATMPMPHNDSIYGAKGRRWYSSASTREMLDYWFKAEDIQELIDLGFRIYEFHVSEYRDLGNEIVFTKESVSKIVDITSEFKLR
jgi:hypothetical protein